MNYKIQSLAAATLCLSYLICTASAIRQDTTKGVTIKKELKQKQMPAAPVTKSNVEFLLFNKQNKVPVNNSSMLFNNGKRYLPDVNSSYHLSLSQGKYRIKTVAIGFHTQNLSLRVEKQYDYTVSIACEMNSTTEN